jgi:hypothetical protein
MDARKSHRAPRRALAREIARSLDEIAGCLEDRYGGSGSAEGDSWAEALAPGGRRGTSALVFLREFGIGDGDAENTAFDAGYVEGLMAAARALFARR